MASAAAIKASSSVSTSSTVTASASAASGTTTAETTKIGNFVVPLDATNDPNGVLGQHGLEKMNEELPTVAVSRQCCFFFKNNTRCQRPAINICSYCCPPAYVDSAFCSKHECHSSAHVDQLQKRFPLECDFPGCSSKEQKEFKACLECGDSPRYPYFCKGHCAHDEHKDKQITVTLHDVVSITSTDYTPVKLFSSQGQPDSTLIYLHPGTETGTIDMANVMNSEGEYGQSVLFSCRKFPVGCPMYNTLREKCYFDYASSECPYGVENPATRSKNFPRLHNLELFAARTYTSPQYSTVLSKCAFWSPQPEYCYRFVLIAVGVYPCQTAPERYLVYDLKAEGDDRFLNWKNPIDNVKSMM